MRRGHEYGATTVEYALLVALCVAVFAAAVWAFETVAGEAFGDSVCENDGYSCQKVE